MLTNIYHIAFAEHEKQAYLHFWGCNMDCRGCECKKAIWDYMLDETMLIHEVEPRAIAVPPTTFLEFDKVIEMLEELGAKWVLFEGQEASLDPLFPRITNALHKKLGTQNVLLTNAYKMPDLNDLDKVCVSLKAFREDLHIAYTGKSNKKILENFIEIYNSGVQLSTEIVLIPEFIDREEIGRVAQFIASVDKNIRLQIDGYFKAGDDPWRRPVESEINDAAEEAKRYLNNVYYYTGNEPREYRSVSIFPTEKEIEKNLVELFLYPLKPADKVSLIVNKGC